MVASILQLVGLLAVIVCAFVFSPLAGAAALGGACLLVGIGIEK